MQAIIYTGNIYNSNLMDKLRGVWGINQVENSNKKPLPYDAGENIIIGGHWQGLTSFEVVVDLFLNLS